MKSWIWSRKTEVVDPIEWLRESLEKALNEFEPDPGHTAATYRQITVKGKQIPPNAGPYLPSAEWHVRLRETCASIARQNKNVVCLTFEDLKHLDNDHIVVLVHMHWNAKEQAE